MSQPSKPLVVHSVSNDGLIVEVRRRIAAGGITRADIFDADSDGEAAGGGYGRF